jgi:hypothetical protein
MQAEVAVIPDANAMAENNASNPKLINIKYNRGRTVLAALRGCQALRTNTQRINFCTTSTRKMAHIHHFVSSTCGISSTTVLKALVIGQFRVTALRGRQRTRP